MLAFCALWAVGSAQEGFTKDEPGGVVSVAGVGGDAICTGVGGCVLCLSARAGCAAAARCSEGLCVGAARRP
jgi:hypothetical protein